MDAREAPRTPWRAVLFGSGVALVTGWVGVDRDWSWEKIAAVVLGIDVAALVVWRRLQGGEQPTRSPMTLPPSPPELDELIRSGRKIEAIKTYRKLHGVGLKEAKSAVEARMKSPGSSSFPS